jgi:ribosomal protein S10
VKNTKFIKHIIKLHSASYISKKMKIEPIQSFISTKNKKKTITLISGPHVHKKSRNQYKIQKYRA